MTDINSASLADIAAAGSDPMLVREVGFWRPYRSWEQLRQVGGMDGPALDWLRGRGFELTPPDDAALAPPKPFKLSTAP